MTDPVTLGELKAFIEMSLDNGATNDTQIVIDPGGSRLMSDYHYHELTGVHLG